MRKYLLAVPALLCLASLTVACAGDRSPTAAAPAAQAVQYSGEALFRGIFFGQGQAGAALPEIWGQGKSVEAHAKNAQELEQLRHQIDVIVAKVRATDPSFMDQFGAAMQSGDRLRIQKGMERGVALLLQAIDTKEMKPADLAALMPCVTVWLAIDYVVAAQVAAVVEVALLWDRSTADGPTLEREQTVDLIARRMGGHQQLPAN